MTKLWLVTQPDEFVTYDCTDSFVFAALTEAEARAYRPSSDVWAPQEQLTVKLLGTAEPGVEGLILSSFNAG